ncbi:MAG: cupin domain-containing protein [Rhodospirillales bacterium]
MATTTVPPSQATRPQLMTHVDSVFQVDPSTTPDYNRGNSLVKLLGIMEKTGLAAERQSYLANSLQYLFPMRRLELYGPAGGDYQILDATRQDNKNDFQKQNVRDFELTDTHLVRGWAVAGNSIAPFLRASYRGGPDSVLSEMSGHRLGQRIKLWIRVNGAQVSSPLVVPYNPLTDRYDIELWSSPVPDLRPLLDDKARDAMDRGELQVRNDLVQGALADFDRGKLEDQYTIFVAPNNIMHPVLPLRIELAWADESERFWDSQNGNNYVYEFNMILRGWDAFLGVGTSPNPHGGVGFLEYRNLISNYGRYAGRNELGRTPEFWNFDAFGSKDHNGRRENFMAVDYMDLHILKANCGIGLHRHRDNQEVFFMLEGQGYMVVGDWVKFPNRERCFEIRTLPAGHFAMLKGGNLHGLMNPSDENISLFMFGGYD